MTIASVPIAQFKDGHRIVALTTSPGEVTERTKTGVRDTAYGKGAVIVADDTVHTIAGPIDRKTAQVLAGRILDGEERTMTQPQILLLMAAAVVAFTDPDAETRAMGKALQRPPRKQQAI